MVSIKAISSTVSMLKRQTKGIKSKPVIDLETIFLRLLLIGQQRKIELGPLFAYQLCLVSPALTDGRGCLRKSMKSDLVKRLGVIDISAKYADTIIVDVSQLFYHIRWPYGGSPSDLIASIEERLSIYYPDANKIVVFDKYQDVSAKDHERMRRARLSEVVIDYELSVASHLPKRDAIMKSKSNKRKLASVLGTFNLGENTTVETFDDGSFQHDEADVTMVSFVL